MRDRLHTAIAAHQPVELDPAGHTAAGVMILIEGPPEAERLVFQVRTHTVRHHRGEISFPGGRRDPEDPDLMATALRETHEEVGVPPEAVRILGQLDDTVTRSTNYLIRPYVGLVEAGASASVVARREVSELLHIPIAQLMDPACHIWWVEDRAGTIETTPAYQFNDHVIWGATARILGQFLQLVEGTA